MARHHHVFALCLFAFTKLASAADLSLSPTQLTALGIETAPVASASASTQGRLPARVVVPNAQMHVIAAPVGGLIERLEVAPGVSVKRGQVLAQLASPQALELQRDAVQASSQSALLQQNLKRDELLFAEGLIAEARLQASRAAAAQAAAQASERSQGLALAGLSPGKIAGKLALTAAIDGVVLEQGVQLGQRVEASALIYRIAKLSPLWLEIQAPLALAAGLRPGNPVKIAGSEVIGELSAVGRAVDAASQTVLLRATVKAGAEMLIPGQVVEVEVASAAAGMPLPASALIRHAGQTYVFVQTGSDAKATQFAARPVQVLKQGGDSLSVSGLQAGQRVAIKGVSGLKAMFTGVGQE